MVNLVRPTCISPPTDGFLPKSQSSEADSLESTSFGEIFKAKEKERKQLEDSASSAAAAMAGVVRTPPAERFAESSPSDSRDRIGSVSEQSLSKPTTGINSPERLSTNSNQKSLDTEKSHSAESQHDEKPSDSVDQAKKSAPQAFAALVDAQGKASEAQAAGENDGVARFAQQIVAAASQDSDQVDAVPVPTQAAGVNSAVTQPESQSDSLSKSPAIAAEVAAVMDLKAAPTQAAAVVTVTQPAGETQAPENATGLGTTIPVQMAEETQAAETVQNQETGSTANTGSGLETAKKLAAETDDISQAVVGNQTQFANKIDVDVSSQPIGLQAAPKTPLSSVDPKTAAALPANGKMIVVDASQDTNPVLAAQQAPITSPPTETVDMKAVGKWAAPQINTQSGEIIQQIVRQLHVTLQTGPSSMRLQLNPKELGAIDVHMVQSPQGVSVTFFAEHGSTGRLLETQIDQLRQSLTNSGIQLSNLNISQHGPSGQQDGSYKQASQFAQQSNRNPAQPEKKAEIETGLRPERVVGQLQGVDYRI